MNNEDRDDLAKALELNKRQAEFYNNISAKEDDELFKGYERNESANLITRLWAKLRYAHQDAFENIGVDTVKNEFLLDHCKKRSGGRFLEIGLYRFGAAGTYPAIVCRGAKSIYQY